MTCKYEDERDKALVKLELATHIINHAYKNIKNSAPIKYDVGGVVFHRMRDFLGLSPRVDKADETIDDIKKYLLSSAEQSTDCPTRLSSWIAMNLSNYIYERDCKKNNKP